MSWELKTKLTGFAVYGFVGLLPFAVCAYMSGPEGVWAMTQGMLLLGVGGSMITAAYLAVATRMRAR